MKSSSNVDQLKCLTNKNDIFDKDHKTLNFNRDLIDQSKELEPKISIHSDENH